MLYARRPTDMAMQWTETWQHYTCNYCTDQNSSVHITSPDLIWHHVNWPRFILTLISLSHGILGRAREAITQLTEFRWSEPRWVVIQGGVTNPISGEEDPFPHLFTTLIVNPSFSRRGDAPPATHATHTRIYSPVVKFKQSRKQSLTITQIIVTVISK